MSRSSSLLAALLCLSVLCVGVLACGGGGGSSPLGASASTGGAATSATPASVSLTFQSSGRPISGNIGLVYKLSHADSAASDVRIEYSTTNGSSWAMASEASGVTTEGITALSTSPTGIEHTFVWASDRDLIAGPYPSVSLRVTPLAGSTAGFPAATQSFAVNASGTVSATAPTVTVTTNLAGTQLSQLVSCGIRVSDTDGSLATVRVDYSTDGVIFKQASPGVGSASMSGIATTTPASLTFQWDSAKDLPNQRKNQVRLRFTPSDAGGYGAPAMSGVFVIDNGSGGGAPPATGAPNQAPVVTWSKPSQGATESASPVTLTYKLADQESDPTNVSVEYYNGSAWASCTEVTGAPSEGMQNLATSPNGVAHTFVWNVATDIPNASQQVFVRITPSDAANTGATASNDFIVNLTGGTPTTGGGPNKAPVCTAITAPSAGSTVTSSPVTVTYTLTDQEGDPCSVLIEFWNGSAFQTCTEFTGGQSQGTSGLVTTAGGAATNFIFEWDAAAATDLGPNGNAQVYLKITPSDAQTGIPYQQQQPVNVQLGSTNAKPACTGIQTPALSSTQTTSPVLIEYTVSDAESDPVSVLVQYWTGSAWATCREDTVTTTPFASEGTTGLSTSPAGVLHRFLWDAAGDLGATANLNTYIQITPSDAQTGTAFAHAQPGFNVTLTGGGGGGGGGGTGGGGTTTGGPLFSSLTPPTPTVTANNGSGAFGTALPGSKSGLGAQDVAVGDFNLDGNADFALCDGGSSNLLIYHGVSNASPTVTLAATVPVGFSGATSAGNRPRTLALADVNNDGWLDILTLNQGSFDFTVVVNMGNGSYLANGDYLTVSTATYNAGSANSWDICAGDFDGDGNIDVACCNQPAQAGFNPAQIQQMLTNPFAFFNTNLGGGAEDVVVFPGAGDSTFGTFTIYAASIAFVCSIEAGDVTGDGLPELIIGNLPSAQANVLGIYANSSTPGTITFTKPADNGTLGASGSASPVDAWGPVNAQNGNGGSAGALDFLIRDITGDGWNDIVQPLTPASATSTDGTLRIWVNSKSWPPAGQAGNPSTQGFTTSHDYSVHHNPYGVTVGDFNGDGKLDVAVSCTETNDVSVRLNSGNAANCLGARVDYPAGHSGWWVSSGDLNNDGKVDIVTSEYLKQGAAAVTGYSIIPGQ